MHCTCFCWRPDDCGSRGRTGAIAFPRCDATAKRQETDPWALLEDSSKFTESGRKLLGIPGNEKKAGNGLPHMSKTMEVEKKSPLLGKTLPTTPASKTKTGADGSRWKSPGPSTSAPERYSPAGSPYVASRERISSPEQLNGYLQRLEKEFDGESWQPREDLFGSPLSKGTGQLGGGLQLPLSPYMPRFPSEQGMHSPDDHQTDPSLHRAADYDTHRQTSYPPRSSWNARHQHTSPDAVYRSSPGILGVSSPFPADALSVQSPTGKVDDILGNLGTNYLEINAIADRLREWFSSKLLKPLHELAVIAHSNVAAEAAKLGFKELMQLPALCKEENMYKSSTSNSGMEDVVLEHCKVQLEGALRELEQKTTNSSPYGLSSWGGMGTLQQQELEIQKYAVSSCLRELVNYQKLRLILRGQYYPGFMPQLPVDYTATRIGVLARGTCCESFEWDRGGDWCGYPWNAEILPTDSHLLFYLFAVYLDAPDWNFHVQPQKSAVGPSGPLFIGELPARCPNKFVAILSGMQRMIPERTSSTAGGLVLAGSRLLPPHFTLGLGRELGELKLGGQNGMFVALSILFYEIDRFEESVLGSLPLVSSLGLGNVLKEGYTSRYFHKRYD